MTVPALKDRITELEETTDKLKTIIQRQTTVIESLVGYLTVIDDNTHIISDSINEAKKHSAKFVLDIQKHLLALSDDPPTSGGTG